MKNKENEENPWLNGTSSCETCTNEKCETNPRKGMMFGGGSMCFKCNMFFCTEKLKTAKDQTKCPKCGGKLVAQR